MQPTGGDIRVLLNRARTDKKVQMETSKAENERPTDVAEEVQRVQSEAVSQMEGTETSVENVQESQEKENDVREHVSESEEIIGTVKDDKVSQ